MISKTLRTVICIGISISANVLVAVIDQHSKTSKPFIISSCLCISSILLGHLILTSSMNLNPGFHVFFESLIGLTALGAALSHYLRVLRDFRDWRARCFTLAPLMMLPLVFKLFTFGKAEVCILLYDSMNTLISVTGWVCFRTWKRRFYASLLVVGCGGLVLVVHGSYGVNHVFVVIGLLVLASVERRVQSLEHKALLS